MILSAILHRRRVSLMQILFALAVSVGLIIFLVADANVSPRFHSLGYILAALSVTADALMVLCQENVFKYGASVEEATFWGTALSFLALILQSVFFGDVREILANMPSKNAYNGVVMAAHALVSYVAVFFHLKMVKEWGSVNTVLVGSSRRALSVILSFLVFPKPFSLLYVVGATLVFGGLVGSGYTNKRAQDFKAPTLSTANAVKSGDPAASNSV
jgi:adenosine 3'-phospho 5'-phosphosulfate transporter B3